MIWVQQVSKKSEEEGGGGGGEAGRKESNKIEIVDVYIFLKGLLASV